MPAQERQERNRRTRIAPLGRLTHVVRKWISHELLDDLAAATAVFTNLSTFLLMHVSWVGAPTSEPESILTRVMVDTHRPAQCVVSEADTGLTEGE